MEIKASSKYDWETVKKFNRFHIFNRARFFNVLIVLMELYMIFIFVFSAISQTFTTGLLPSFCLFLLWNALIIFVYFGLPKIRYNKNRVVKNSENHFVFTENDVTETSDNGMHNGTSVVKYDAMWRVYETKGYIYLYINSNQSYIVDKSTVEGGTTEDLRMLLISKIGADKYKVKIKV